MDKLLGISVAFADGNIPSDWWLVSVTGGEPRQLTHTQSLALYGSYSPDNRFIASDSANGIFVMKPDGTGVTQLLSTTGGNAATVDWIP